MYQFLENNFSHINIIKGDAGYLDQLLPGSWVGQVDVIVSGIPMVNLSFEVQYQIVQACFKSLSPNGTLLQFTYGPLSPLPSQRLGLKPKRLGHVLLNFPPATVWQYHLKGERVTQKLSSTSRLKRQGLHQLQRLKRQSLKVLKINDKN
jgi:phosphatidylethanolamine/phosphatidyl-N-methylethanolamine N-methyltransferase